MRRPSWSGRLDGVRRGGGWSGMKVGAAAWGLRQIRSESEFWAHLREVVEQAHDLQVELLVLPELPVLELLGLFPDVAEERVPSVLGVFSERYEDELFALSSSAGMTIVGGSFFRIRDGDFHNVCITVEPATTEVAGVSGSGFVTQEGVYQEKVNLTTYEREVWRLSPGKGLSRYANPRLGVTICYDAEFPEAVRALAETGTEVLAVPSFTETQHGHQRVRWCCQARAVENQIFVLHATLVGNLGREPVPGTFGSAAVLCPSIEPFPVSAVLAETALNEPGLAVADLDFDMLAECRRGGAVRNWADRHKGDWTVAGWGVPGRLR